MTAPLRKVVKLALKETELTQRELVVTFTDRKYFCNKGFDVSDFESA
jgi:hypothetical protein